MKHCFEALDLKPIASPRSITGNARKVINQFYRDRNYEPVLKLAEDYVSFEDRPWNMWEMYRYLDQRFPNSYFILTIRDPESWWRSTEHWITVAKPEMGQLYQRHLRTTDISKGSMVESYLRYNEEIRQYFNGTNKLLEFNLEAGDEWKKLCHFLDQPIPLRSFPHVNRQKYTDADSVRIRESRLLRRGIQCQACKHITLPAKKSSPGTDRGAGHKQLRRVVIHRLRSWNNSVKRLLLPFNSYIHRWFYSIHSARQSLHSGTTSRDFSGHKPIDSQEFAVVSCFFNPGGSQRRVENFKAFHDGILATGVRCVVVELAFGTTPFQLGEHEDIIQLRTNDVMWHKEALLNIGIRRLLAAGTEKIAWLDGDIIFDDTDWAYHIARELDEVNLCQVFSTVEIVGEDGSTPEVGPSAIKYYKDTGKYFTQNPRSLRGLLRGHLRGGQSGFGWAARAEVFDKTLLYDRVIVGGGDKLILAASLTDNLADERLGALTHSTIRCELCGHRNYSEAYSDSFLDWAKGWSEAVGAKVGYANLHISDMYHGKRSDRKYMTRRDLLYRHNYDPNSDISLDDTGLLDWTSEKSELHHDIEAYFLSRREDV